VELARPSGVESRSRGSAIDKFGGRHLPATRAAGVEIVVELPRARQDKPDAPIIDDPQPLASMADFWGAAAPMATVGLFFLAVVACLSLCGPILLPVLAAALIGTTFAPIIKHANQHGISPWLASILIVALMTAATALAVTMLAAPITEWIGRAPEIGANIKQRLYVFDRPLAAFHELEQALRPAAPAVAVQPSNISMVTPLAAAVTPALAESVLFFATLIFFMAGQMKFRRYLAAFFETRDGKLRFIRIANDIEHNLASYVTIVTAINAALGTIVACGAWLIGLPNPLILGVLAMLLNYLPYVGPACMAIILFAVGFVTFASLGQAFIAPASLIVLTTVEGHVITPTVLGRSLTLDPLAVFLAIAFWSWLWGPMGAFLAVPLLIVAMVIIDHVFPSYDVKLPG
jgi:predicted PurR-regulated permease PerM